MSEQSGSSAPAADEEQRERESDDQVATVPFEWCTDWHVRR